MKAQLPKEKTKNGSSKPRLEAIGEANSSFDFDEALEEEMANAEPEVNEKWLISYSDLMTLMFGFFVLLYALAMDSKGNPGKALKTIMQGRQGDFETPEMAEQREQEIREFKIKINDLIEESESYQENIKSLEANVQSLTAELNQEKENLEKRLQQERLLSEEKLKKALAQWNAQVANFMIVMIQWDTKAHDIDLRITDPLGRLFDFQNRSYSSSKSKFMLDSRSGPGVEMWETPQIEQGDYLLEFKFYNAYNNNKPAQIRGSILTRKGIFDIPPVTLDFEKMKQKRFKLRASANGEIIIGPQT